MSRLTELIGQLKRTDNKLAEEIEKEVKVLSSRREFGLNFERHKPEVVELPLRKVRKGDKVRILQERGYTEKIFEDIWLVKKIIKSEKVQKALIISVIKGSKEEKEIDIDNLIVVAEFRDSIYPGLLSTGTVNRGGDKPFHTVINGENYHALKALSFTHKARVDLIYIDPPYNSGAKDWKYNNDYVESEDNYRHSKWLAFMERRFKVAKKLLNPDDSVLIVTIDEKEYLRLGLLLEQTFPEARIQMVTSVISPKGSARRGYFSRADEYIYFVFFGAAYVSSSSSDMLRDPVSKEAPVRWKSLMRSAGNGLRTARPNLFYPLFLDKDSGAFVGAGEPLLNSKSRKKVEAPKGAILMWPIGNDGRELTWSLSRDTMLSNHSKGYVRFGPWDGEKRTPYYLTSGQIKDIEEEGGQLTITGKDADGALELSYGSSGRQYQPLTVWNRVSHSATEHGTGILKLLLPDRSFPFPKSLYAVEDTLRFFVANKPDAIVLDFFAGSGTTVHAVMRLNKQDDGNRQCISITNNEVSADEQKSLREKGLRPGDDEWEKWGICNYITKPRVEAAIQGKASSGKNIKGSYKFTDEFPMSDGFNENAEFFDLTYESLISVSHNLGFKQISPLLWLRAGAKGERINEVPAEGWKTVETYGVLMDLDKAKDFCNEIKANKTIQLACIFTNDEKRFQSVVRDLPDYVEAIRLYESYLKNFQFMSGE
ncbi:MAG: DNA methyltransferase [Bacteriovoracaceae bacterium]|nr:DNA methyltransferase [Bacteriovoracaceae bacterium]